MHLKINRVGIFLIIALASMFVCGCNNNSKTSNNYNKAQKEWKREKLDDKLVADFKADNIPRKNYNSYEVEYTLVPVKKIKDIFFDKDKSKTSITKEEREDDSDMEELTSENGLYIYSTIEGTNGRTKESDYYRAFLGYDSDAWDVNNMPTNLGTEDELSFLSKKKLDEKIEKRIKEILPGFSVGNFNVRSLTSDYLNSIQNKYFEEAEKSSDEMIREEYKEQQQWKKNWRKKDDAYYVVAELSLDGININSGETMELSNGKNINPVYITIIYNKNGFVYVDFSSVIKVKNRKEDEIVTVAQALKSLKDDLTSIILTDEKTIKDAQFRYVMISTSDNKKIEIRPVWIFDVMVKLEQKNKDDDNGEEIYMVDAVTGEVLR